MIHRRLFLALAVFLAAPLGGCLEFSHGVADIPAPNDRRLLGYWEIDDKKDPTGLLVEEASPHSLRVTMRDIRKCKDDILILTRTEIDGRGFLHVETFNDETRQGGPDTLPMAYDITDGTRLRLFLPADAAFKAAIANGELEGTVHKEEYMETIRVKASTPDLRRYLAAHPEAMEEVSSVQILRQPAPPASTCSGTVK